MFDNDMSRKQHDGRFGNYMDVDSEEETSQRRRRVRSANANLRDSRRKSRHP